MAATPPPPGYPPPGGYPPGPPAPGGPSDRPFPPPGGPQPPPPPGGGWPPQGTRGPGGPPPGPWPQPPPGGYGYGGVGGYAMPKAGWWARLAALLIDVVIIALFSIPAFIVLRTGPTEIQACSVDESGDVQFGEPDNAICKVPTGGTWAAFAALEVAATAAGLAYWAILEGKRTQTLGKKALGIRVVDATTAQPIGPGRDIGRQFARILSAIPCYLGYFWPLWDDQSQAWHDKIVSSVVVKA